MPLCKPPYPCLIGCGLCKPPLPLLWALFNWFWVFIGLLGVMILKLNINNWHMFKFLI
jgi:hypothetical protein